MRISDGSGLDGVSGAAEPEPAFDGDGDSRLYANNTPASQAYFNDDAPPSFERVREMTEPDLRNRKCELDEALRCQIPQLCTALFPRGAKPQRGYRRPRHADCWQVGQFSFISICMHGATRGSWRIARVRGQSPVELIRLLYDFTLSQALDWVAAWLKNPNIEVPPIKLPRLDRFTRRELERAGATVASPDVPDDRPIPINAPAASPATPAPPRADVEADVEPEDASLLDPPEVSDLPVTTPEARQAKRKLVIESMKADRRPALRLVHSVAAPSINEPPPPQESPEIEEPLPPLVRAADFSEAVRQVMPASPSLATTTATEQQPPPPPSSQAPRPRSRKPSKTTIPLDEKDQALCLGIQDKELRFLVRLYKAGRQERGEPFVSQADMIQQWGINRNILYETDEIGRRIGFTPEKDEFIGHNALGRPSIRYKRKGKFTTIPPEQFLKRITPGNETPAETKVRRAKSKRDKRRRRRREIRAEERAITKARRAQAADVDCRRSAVSVVLTTKWVTIGQVGKELPQTTAFRDRNGKQLTGRSLHQAILRILRRAPLCDAIETQTRVDKFGNSILYMRRRP